MAAGQFSTTLVLETSGIVSLELATARLQSRRRTGDFSDAEAAYPLQLYKNDIEVVLA